jgi:hypothetical protein
VAGFLDATSGGTNLSVVELRELDSELLPAPEEDDDAVQFWAVLAGLAIGPVRWAGGPVQSGKFFSVSFSISVFLL